jgi:hypothetical protein
LRDFFRPSDKFQRFFVEGNRSQGASTRFLPIIERVECDRSRHLDDAMVELRTLRDGRPQTGVRIIGRVYSSWRDQPRPLPGIEVQIKGPAGSMLAVTDSQGVYDVNDLPSGQYTVELSTTSAHPVCAVNLQKLAVDGCSLFLDEVHGPTI